MFSFKVSMSDDFVAELIESGVSSSPLVVNSVKRALADGDLRYIAGIAFETGLVMLKLKVASSSSDSFHAKLILSSLLDDVRRTNASAIDKRFNSDPSFKSRVMGIFNKCVN